jgi:hypothetical protein
MTITPEIQSEILAEYAKNPQRFSPFRTAKALGVPIQDVMATVDKSKDLTARMTVRFDGYGRPEMQDYFVARRRAMAQGWDNNEEVIAQARANFEEGTHDMATGRDGPWLILYAIPRRRKTPRPGYFNTESFS